MHDLLSHRHVRVRRRGAPFFLAAALVAASGAADVPTKKSASGDREDVSITVYNQNFGLVREVREIDIGTGALNLEFRDVASRLQPQTVHIKSLSGEGNFEVLEQNYRYDLLTPSKLLEKYVGKQLRVYRYNKTTGKDDRFEAKVLSVAGGSPVLQIDNEITYGFNGRFAFPSLPTSLIPKPTLVWLINSKRAKQKVEVTYLTRQINWSADYVMVINARDTRGALNGWVTLKNNSGATYTNAKLKLVAGDVQRVASGRSWRDGAPPPPAAPMGGEAGFKQESLFEYHLYSLQRATTVAEKEQKQVNLLTAPKIKLNKKLIFFGARHYYRGRYGQVQSNQKVGVYLDIVNSKANGLGMPLPKGTVRVYKADKSGAKQFVGEDNIDHTPRDEKVRIKMGNAFDVVGSRKQMSWKKFGSCTYESTWEVEVRNHKDETATVELFEPVGGDWKIMQSSQKHKKLDAHTFTFTVKVPKNGKKKVTYRVRTRWC